MNKSPTERANELYHHGIKGQKWGVRRFQNEDGTLTDAGKRRQAREEYRSDLKNEIQKAKNDDDKFEAQTMSAALTKGKTYVTNILGYGLAGAAGTALGRAAVDVIKGNAGSITGEKLVRNAILGGIGGMLFGSIKASGYINTGEHFAFARGVKPLFKRLDELGVQGKDPKTVNQHKAATADQYKRMAESSKADFDKDIEYMSRLKKEGPTGETMRDMYFDEDLVDTKQAKQLWKDELEYANHHANISMSRYNAYTKASEQVAALQTTNATPKDLEQYANGVAYDSFGVGGKDKNYYKDL